MSLSWCRQDSDLLLSCGKDNRTLCWNPQTGEPYGEFPVVTNWTFQTRWNPHNPSLLATASFDGKIAIQTVQNTKIDGQTGGNQAPALDGEDFFNKAQSQPQSASFTLPKAPKWLERPCGASFGFGGKVISFTRAASEGDAPRKSAIRISNFAADTEIGTMTEAFEKAMTEKNLKAVCESRIEQSSLDTEKTDWKVIGTLMADNPRKELVNYLGFSKDEDESSSRISNEGANGDVSNELGISKSNGESSARNNRLSSFFDTTNEGDNFLADLAATKGAKTNNPFQLYSDSESASDRKITQALMLGQFDKALEVCLQEDRLSDAFMIAICGGQDSIEKVQKAYFTKQSSGPKYLRLLASVVGKNLWDVVYNADLRNWREVMATLCTYASAEEFPDLCEALGDRLEDQIDNDSVRSGARNDASFCYIAGSKLEKVVKLWISEIEKDEKSSSPSTTADSSFSVHVRALQSFIEKVTIFREVTQYRDNDRSAASDWKLAPLYEKYTEYADIVAAHGQLQIAEKYLDLLPEKYPAAEVARNRVKQATRKATIQSTARQPTNAGSIPNRGTMSSSGPVQRQQLNVPGFESQQAPSLYQPSRASNPYQPQEPAQTPHVYPSQSQGPYGVPSYQGGQPPRHQYGMQPAPGYGAPPPVQGHAAPPRNVNASPAVAPPSKATNMPNWNDMPEDFFKAPTSRRGTPGVQPATINAPFSSQPTMSTPPVSNQQFQSRATPPGPPPPKGSAPPPRSNTPQTNGRPPYQQPDRPTSSASNAYIPQQPPSQFGGFQQQQQQQPQIPRGASPYNAPPSAPPAGGRYAPAPVPQTSAPMTQRAPPPQNPYAAQPNLSNQGGNAPAMPPQSSAPPPQSTRSPVSPPVPRPDSTQSQQARPQKPATPKHRMSSFQTASVHDQSTNNFPAPGDRSHIPADAHIIYNNLNEDMQRVKAKAPASFKMQVNDTEKRLNILFDHLNNEDLLKPNTVQDMVELAQALRARDYEQAQAIHIDIMTHRTDECGNWMVSPDERLRKIPY